AATFFPSCVLFSSCSSGWYPLPFPTRRSSDLMRSSCGSYHLRTRPIWPGHSEASVSMPSSPVSAAQSSAALPGIRYSRSTLHERSEEHTSELQSRENLVCRLLLEKKNQNNTGL